LIGSIRVMPPSTTYWPRLMPGSVSPTTTAPSVIAPSVIAPGVTTLLIWVMWSAFWLRRQSSGFSPGSASHSPHSVPFTGSELYSPKE
jgi:hypothetical protein